MNVCMTFLICLKEHFRLKYLKDKISMFPLFLKSSNIDLCLILKLCKFFYVFRCGDQVVYKFGVKMD